jgi:hypothetical protein
MDENSGAEIQVPGWRVVVVLRWFGWCMIVTFNGNHETNY